MEESTITKVTIIIIVASAIIIGFFFWDANRPPDIARFDLAEISDGIYVYREVVVSSIPAENYTMATVCDKSGNIFTVKGTVKIVNQSDEPPYAVLEDYNIVNSDVITVYVPKGTVQYLGTVNSKS